MPNKRMESDKTRLASRVRANTKSLEAVPDFLDLLGGEKLEGSGFEEELPEPDFKWRDPR